MSFEIIRPESNLGKTTYLGKFFDTLRANLYGGIENDDYGNRSILAEYCGVSVSNRIPGRIQHGWVFRDKSGHYYLNDYVPSYVWTKNAKLSAESRGWKNFTDIGAPWLYLLKVLERDGWGSLEKSKLQKNYPNRELWVFGKHADLISDSISTELLEFLMRAKNDSNQKTILLQYRDFDTVKRVKPELIEDLNIVTLGQRINAATSQAHLFRIYSLLISHNKLVIDWPSALLLYGLTLNMEIFFLKSSTFECALLDVQKLGDFELLGLLSIPALTSGAHRDFAYQRLGIDSLKTPLELRRLLKWKKRSYFSDIKALFILPKLCISISVRFIKQKTFSRSLN
jgi:hypothetical protein